MPSDEIRGIAAWLPEQDCQELSSARAIRTLHGLQDTTAMQAVPYAVPEPDEVTRARARQSAAELQAMYGVPPSAEVGYSRPPPPIEIRWVIGRAPPNVDARARVVDARARVVNTRAGRLADERGIAPCTEEYFRVYVECLLEEFGGLVASVTMGALRWDRARLSLTDSGYSYEQAVQDQRDTLARQMRRCSRTRYDMILDDD